MCKHTHHHHGDHGHHKQHGRHGSYAYRHHMRAHMGRRVAGFLIGGFLLTLVWNSLVPDLFGGPGITYLQALGLMFLTRLLTGNWDMGRSHAGHHGPWRAAFRQKMKEKMAGMSPEERERFREGFSKGRWDVNIFEVEDEASDEGQSTSGDDASHTPSDEDEPPRK
ncbi:MAG: hypothetical protein D6722_19835 [Bacteroidetes bacterium]|nr:MAG: hypothetical protein D6722_19835 [Bacteroidota bacterium]